MGWVSLWNHSYSRDVVQVTLASYNAGSSVWGGPLHMVKQFYIKCFHLK